MSITDYFKDRKQEVLYSKNMGEAEAIFMRQRESIKAIKETQGFKEIVAYWERQKDENERMLDSHSEKECYYKLYKQSKQFLTFLENLTEG